MADLIQIQYEVVDKGKSLKTAFTGVERMEKSLAKLSKQIVAGTTTQDRQRKALIAYGRELKRLTGMTGNQAYGAVVKYNNAVIKQTLAQDKATAASQRLARVQEYLASRQNRATASTLRQNSAITQSAVAANTAGAAMNQYGRVSALGGKKMNRTNMIIQQSGYQFQDFAVQIQGGTNAFVALGQQGSQLLGVFGPAGAVLGAFLAVGTAIARMKTDGSNLSFDFKRFGADVAKSLEPIKPILGAIGSVFSTVGKIMGAAANFIVQNLSSILTIAITLGAYVGGGLALAFLKSGKALKVLNAGLTLLRANMLKTGILAVVVLVGYLIHEFTKVVDSVGSLGKAFSTIWGIAKKIFGNLVNLAQLCYYNIMQVASEFVLDALLGLKDLVVNYGEGFNKIAVVAKGTFSGLKAVFFALPAIALESGKQIADGLITGLQYLVDGFILAFNEIGGFTKGLVAGIKAVFESLPKAVGDIAKLAANGFIEGMEMLANGALGAINKVMGGFNKIANFFGIDKARDFFGFEGDILKPFDDVDLNEYKSNISEAGKTLGDSFKTAFEEASGGSEGLELLEGINLDAARPEITGVGTILSKTFTDAYKEAFDNSNAEKPVTDFLNKAIIKTDEWAKAYGELSKSAKKALASSMGEKSVDDLASYFTLVEKEAKGAGKGVDKLAEALNSPLEDAIGSISNAFGDFIARGLKDFKSFSRSIVDSFKQMISTMIATAMKNKIMLSMGMGGAALGTAAQAGQLPGMGAPAGGSMVGNLIGGFGVANGAAGTGLLGGAASSLSGFATGGLSGGFSAISSSMVGATSSIGAFGASVGAIAAPLLAVAAVFSLFKKRTKQLDVGLQGTINTLDFTLESFSKIQTKRFFSKRVSETATTLSEEEANPLIEGLTAMQQGIMNSAEALGYGSTVFNEFSHDFKLSLAGLTEDQKMAKISEEFTKMGDSFASLIPHIGSMQELSAVLQQRVDFETQLLVAAGDVVELRKQELATVHILNKSLAARLQLLQAEANMDTALQTFASGIAEQQGLIRQAVDALVSPLQEALDLFKGSAEDSYNIFKEASGKARTEAKAFVDILRGALNSRKINSEAVEIQNYRTSQQQLTSFAGGAEYDKESLGKAAQGVSIDSQKFFGSFEDYARDFYKTQHTLEELEAKAAKELTDVEVQIAIAEKAYKMVMGTYQESVDMNTSLDTLLSDLAAYAEVSARNEPLINQIKAEGDRQILALDSILEPLGLIATSNMSVGKALDTLGIKEGKMAGAVVALATPVAAIGSHIDDLDTSLAGAYSNLGLNIKALKDLDIAGALKTLDFFAPLSESNIAAAFAGVDLATPFGELNLATLFNENVSFSAAFTEAFADVDLTGDLAANANALADKAKELNSGVVGLDGKILDFNTGLTTSLGLLGKSTDTLGTKLDTLGTKLEEAMGTDGLSGYLDVLQAAIGDETTGLGKLVGNLSTAISGLTLANTALVTAQTVANDAKAADDKRIADAAAKAISDAAAKVISDAAAKVISDAAAEAKAIADAAEAKKGIPTYFNGNLERSAGEVTSSKSSIGDTRPQSYNDVVSGQGQNFGGSVRGAVDAAMDWAGFARGGMHGGGLRMVGEEGPELEATGPSRIYSKKDTASMLSGGSESVVAELRNLRHEVSELKAEQRKVGVENVKYNKKSYDLYREWDTVGLPATRTS